MQHRQLIYVPFFFSVAIFIRIVKKHSSAAGHRMDNPSLIAHLRDVIIHMDLQLFMSGDRRRRRWISSDRHIRFHIST